MKIGILTFHRSHNYGAFLQAFALASSIKEKIRCEVEIIDYNMAYAEKLYKKAICPVKQPYLVFDYYKRYKMFKKTVEVMPKSEEKLVSNDLHEFQRFVKGRYDIIIAGSDEIWKIDGFRGFPNPYWLIGDLDCIKISYAASSRVEIEKLSKDVSNKVQKYLDDFQYIGVRDQVTKDLAVHYTENIEKIHLNCDPVFTFDFKPNKDNGKRILREKFGVHKKKCLAIMSSNKEIAKSISRELPRDIGVITLFTKINGLKYVADLTPFEWIDCIAACDFLVTTFFHGMCFAIKCNTPFCIIEVRKIKEKRFSKSYDLLSRVGMEKQYFSLYDERIDRKVISLIDQALHGQNVDYENIVKGQYQYFLEFISYLEGISSHIN